MFNYCRHLGRGRFAAPALLVVVLAAAPAAGLDIPITIEELLPAGEAGVARLSAPLRFGVPLPQTAAVDSTTPISLPGLPTPQVRPLAKYASGAWRWMLVETVADLQAGERRTATLSVGSGGFANGPALATAGSDAIVVDTGPAQFSIRRLGWNGLDAVTVGGVTRIAAGHGLGLQAADSSGSIYGSALDTQGSVGLESNGPLDATLVARGWLRNSGGAALFAYTARMRFTRGRSDVELEITVRNAEQARLRPVYFRWVSFRLPLAYGASASLPVAFGLNGTTRTAGLDSAGALLLYQGRTTFREDNGTNANIRPYLTTDDGVLATAAQVTLNARGNTADHLDGWLVAGGSTYSGTSEVSLAVRDLAPLYPTGLRLGAVESGARVLAYDILSPANSRTAPLLWAWGAHHTGTAILGFGTSAQQSWAQVQYPVFGRPSFESVRQAGGIYGENRLVDYATQNAWFGLQGHNYTLNLPTFSKLTVQRWYHFGTTGGSNQYDQNLTFILDYLRAGATSKMLAALQDASWKSDQAVMHSDDFDFGNLALNESDPNVTDPDCWNGHGAGANFDNEHPHWLTLPVLYYMTGDERLREASVDYCEWRRYRAGNHSYGPIYGKGMTALRLWSRAWRDIALAWELTGRQRYYDDMVRMTQALVSSVEAPGKNGRNYDRGYMYFGDWSSADRPIRLFFAIEILGTDAREVLRLLPEGPLREDLRDFLTGLSYFTIESRLGSQNIGFPYTYYVAGDNAPGTRGDQVGMLMAHGYEWTGEAIFADMARDLAWRPIVYADQERGSEPAALVRCYTDLHRAEIGVGWIRDLQVSGSNGSYTLTWTAPAGATSYIVKYAREPMVSNLWYDAMLKTWRYDPKQYTPFWAGTNVQGEPAPGPAGAVEHMTLTGLDPSVARYFAIEYRTQAPVASPLGAVSVATPTYDASGRPVLTWTRPSVATGVRVVRNDTAYEGFAAWPEHGTRVYEGSGLSSADSTLLPGSGFKRGHKYYYTLFATDGSGRNGEGTRVALTYAPPLLPPVITAASASPASGEAALTVQLEGHATDPDQNLKLLSWDFGDGTSPVASSTASHTYSQAGTYAARFTATDSTGLSSSQIVSLTVLPPQPPQVSLSANAVSGRAPLQVIFTARVTDASPLADSLWIFGAGDSVRATRATHTFTAGGRSVARFRAVDSHGLAALDSVALQLLPPDLEAPRVVSLSPQAGSTGVPRATAFRIVLADSGTGVQPSSVRLAIDGVSVDPSLAASGDTLTLRYTPPAPFAYSQIVRVRLQASDRAATPNGVDSTWTFTTIRDDVPPVVLSRSPAPGATKVPRATSIEVALTDSISGLDAASLVLEMNGAGVTPVVEWASGVATLRYTPPSAFSYGDTVRIRLRAADRVVPANVLESTWRFTIKRDLEAPALVSATPGGGAANVQRAAPIVMALADSMTGIDLSSLSLQINGSSVDAALSGTPAAASLRYVPAVPFAWGATVQARLRAADRAIPPNLVDSTWSFTIQRDLEAPRLVSRQPVPGTPDAPRGSGIAVTVADSLAGLDLASLVLQVNDAPVDPTVSGTAAMATLRYAPSETFGYGATVKVRLRISDRAPTPNVADSTWTFTIRPDRDAPLLVSPNPAPRARNVSRTTDIAVTVVDSTTGVDLSSISMFVNGARVVPTLGGTPASTLVRWVPAVPFAYGTLVQVRLRAMDRALVPNARDSTWSFTVMGLDRQPPALMSRMPAPRATNVSCATDIAVTLADSVTGLNLASISMLVNGAAVQPLVNGSPASATLRYAPAAPFTYGAAVKVRVRAADRAPTPNVVDSTWTFTTQVDKQPPVVISRAPTPGGIPASNRSNVIVAIADSMSGLNLAKLTLYVNGTSVKPQVDGDSKSAVATYAKSSAFPYGKPVSVRVRIPDRAATPNVLDETWNFQVEMAPKLISFQPATSKAPAGYVADVGNLYSTSAGFGWSQKVPVETKATSSDPRLNGDAYVINPGSATWQAALPAGNYSVTLVAGSPSWSASNRIEIEGSVVVDNVSTLPGAYCNVNNFVTAVNDGFLTVRVGGISGASQPTRVCYIEIRHALDNSIAGRIRKSAPPRASASATPTSGTAPLEVRFLGAEQQISSDAARYVWHFGDGTSAEGREPHHVYRAAGSYSVLLEVQNEAGEQSQDTLQVQVTAAQPAPGPQPGPAPGAQALRFNFQPRDFATPAGYVAESGEPFAAERGYGWDEAVPTDRAHTNFDAVRNSYVAVDNRHTASFSVVLPRGTYRVSLVAGSPKASAENRVAVEGQVVVRDVATRAGGFVEVRDCQVEVVDGSLTVVLGGTGRRGETKLCSLEIVPLETSPAIDPARGPELRVDGMGRTRSPVIELAAPRASALRLRIFDARGRLVRTLWEGNLAAGSLRLQWDGNDTQGRAAASGMYFVLAELGPRSLSKKLLYLR